MSPKRYRQVPVGPVTEGGTVCGGNTESLLGRLRRSITTFGGRAPTTSMYAPEDAMRTDGGAEKKRRRERENDPKR